MQSVAIARAAEECLRLYMCVLREIAGREAAPPKVTKNRRRRIAEIFVRSIING